ncbi:ADP-ribosyltransferase [Paenibacillus larvae]
MNKDKNVSLYGQKDFKKDREKAKKWTEENFKEWKNSLNSEQKKLLKDSARIQKVNAELKKFRGRFIGDDSIRKDVDKLDKALEDKSAKLDHSIRIYRNLTSEELGYALDSFYEKGKMTIDWEQYRQFSDDFKYGLIHDFMKANLTHHSKNRSYPILLDLKAPKGNSMGYLKEDKVFIDRNQGYQVNSIKIIVEKGREVIKVEAELISSTEVTDRIKAAQIRLNDKFTQELGIEKSALEFKINGFYSSLMTHRSELLLENLVSNVPRNIMVDTVKKMNRNASFIFTDNSLDFHGGDGDEKGFYDSNYKTLTISINDKEHISKKDDDIITLTHEFGHAVDHLLFKKISEKDTEFIKIYEKEKNNITIEKYIKQDSVEFFAGVFGYLYSPNPQHREQIQKEAPKACEFIKNLIENYQPDHSTEAA